MTFTFSTGLWLLVGVAALGALVLFEAAQRSKRLARLGDLGLLAQQTEGADEGWRLAQRLAAVVSAAALVVAVAGPELGETSELMPRRGLDLVFAVDVSQSMRARDVRPDRLERVKAEISDTIGRFGENRVGLIAFAGTAFVQCPLTTDVEALRSFLGALDPKSVPQGGTDLGAGLDVAANLFTAEAEQNESSRLAGRLLVIFSDGEDHQGGMDAPAARLKQLGVQTIVIGVGSELGEPIPIVDADGSVIGYKKTNRGQTVMSRMSPVTLSLVAKTTGGAFIDGTARADLGITDIEGAVAALEKRELQSRVRTDRTSRTAWPLAIALLFLLFAFAVPPLQSRAQPQRPLAREEIRSDR